MNDEATLFEIAIYRVDPVAWEADTSARLARRMPPAGRTKGVNEPSAPDAFAMRAERPYEWQYNEIIAWVRLRTDGPGRVVKAYCYEVASRVGWGELTPRTRYQRGFKPFPFAYGDPFAKVFELWIEDDWTDQQIYASLVQKFKELVAKAGWFPGRYLDLRAFEAVGPYVRWREAVRGGSDVAPPGHR